MSSDHHDSLGLCGSVVDQKYRVESVIGEGGFSVVYRAEHIVWKQPVALKCFNALAGVPAHMRQELLQAFIQEGKLMTNLSSRTAAIVQARDVGTLTSPRTGDQVPYMVLEWLDGRPLDRIFATEHAARMPPRSIYEVLSLLEPVASALDVVHAQGIAHRDIKPANLFIIGDPRGVGAFVKILDFGIAKVMAEHAHVQTALAQTGREITAFTPNYGAPEQFSRSHGATGPWTDVFSLALIMVEMLRGGIPALQGDDYIQLAVASRDPTVRPSPRAFGVPVSDAVESVFLKALAVSPRDRYKTAGQFWADLHGALFPDNPMWNPATTGGGSGGYTSGGNTGRPRMSMTPITGPGMTVVDPNTGRGMMTGPPSATTSGVAASPSPPRQGGSGAMIFIAIAGLALAAGGVGAFLWLKGKQAVPDAAASADPVTSASAAPIVADVTCPEGMVKVPGGKFFQGSDDDSFPLWVPAHNVSLSGFCIGVHEVTAGEYKACVDKGECKRAPMAPSYPKSEKTTPAQHEKNLKAYAELCNIGENGQVKSGRDKHAMNCITWDLADSYCKVGGGRLPTEAEWEYAARGSDGRKYPWGDEEGADGHHFNACGKECAAWEEAHGVEPKTTPMYDLDDGFPGTGPVGSFPKGVTKFGMHDMVGNVWEWTSDWFATYGKDDLTNPTGAPVGDKKAIRGGGFNGSVTLWMNPAFRYHQIANAASHGIGFRCAKTLPEPKAP